jgi:hypothetical protein
MNNDTREANTKRFDPRVAEAVLAKVELHFYAERLLGARGWPLLSTYGRVTAGPRSGSYVSELPTSEAKQVVDALAQGIQVPVHLTHRHESGCNESSELQLVEGWLLMVFADRDELA